MRCGRRKNRGASPPLGASAPYIGMVGGMRRRFAVDSQLCSVLQVHDAVLETSFIDQFEVNASMFGEPVVAASNHDRCDELDDLVNQSSFDCLSREFCAANADITFCIS